VNIEVFAEAGRGHRPRPPASRFANLAISQQTNSKTGRIGVISALGPVVDGAADGSGAYGGCADAPTRMDSTMISACMVDAACMMGAATAAASRQGVSRNTCDANDCRCCDGSDCSI
jgi:hypothetical protein